MEGTSWGFNDGPQRAAASKRKELAFLCLCVMLLRGGKVSNKRQQPMQSRIEDHADYVRWSTHLRTAGTGCDPIPLLALPLDLKGEEQVCGSPSASRQDAN